MAGHSSTPKKQDILLDAFASKQPTRAKLDREMNEGVIGSCYQGNYKYKGKTRIKNQAKTVAATLRLSSLDAAGLKAPPPTPLLRYAYGTPSPPFPATLSV